MQRCVFFVCSVLYTLMCMMGKFNGLVCIGQVVRMGFGCYVLLILMKDDVITKTLIRVEEK